VALSTTEAKYIATESFCAQTLWLKQQLSYFGLNLNNIPLLCDNTSVINLTKKIISCIYAQSILRLYMISFVSIFQMAIVKLNS